MPCFLLSDLGVVEELRLAMDIPDDAREAFEIAVSKIPLVVSCGKVTAKEVQRLEQPDGRVIYKSHITLSFTVPSGYEQKMEKALTELREKIRLFVTPWDSQHG